MLLRLFIFAFFCLSVNYSLVTAQESNPLQPFEFLIGGEWSTETTVQTFNWGVGQKTVHSELHFIANEDTSLAGEITWFWHPGEKKIKGYGHLLSDQLIFFDYSTDFSSERRMENTILGYNVIGYEVNIIESIEFIDEDQYLWTMYDRVLDELKPQLSITFSRKN